MAERITLNPYLIPAPDYAGEAHRPIREYLAQIGQNEEVAIASLLAGWTTDNAAKRVAWDQQVESDAQVAAEEERIIQEEQDRARLEVEAEKKEAAKKRPKLPPLDLSVGSERKMLRQISPYARNLVKNQKRCDLWYFTAEGIEEAKGLSLTRSEESYALAGTGSNITLQKSAAHKSSAKAVPDSLLTFSQFSIAHSQLTERMEALDWASDIVKMFQKFFYLLEHHEIRLREFGDRAILLYQENARIDWHAYADIHDKVYNIAIFKEEDIEECYRDIEAGENKSLRLATRAEHETRRTAGPLSGRKRTQPAFGTVAQCPQHVEGEAQATNPSEEIKPFAPEMGRNPRSYALYASVAIPTEYHSARQPLSGMEARPDAREFGGKSLLPTTPKFASTGKERRVARSRTRGIITSARDVGGRNMEPSHALSLRRFNPSTPLIARNWEHLMSEAGISEKYPYIVNGIKLGFNVGIPIITSTHTPPNSNTLYDNLAEFERIVDHEFAQERYLGPFNQQELESLIGCFQSSPLSLVPKPNKPHIFRLVQNYSFPRNPRGDYTSINSHINSNDFPCTWGTADSFSLLIWHLPPGSQGAVRDVSEAYRIIPLHHSQWPGTVVRLSENDEFIVDTQAAFGLTTNSGKFGGITDGGNDIMRHKGLGPVIKWVDDHVFIRILLRHLRKYNELRSFWASIIAKNGGRHHVKGRHLYRGRPLPNGRTEEFVEDMSFPVQDLSRRTARSESDAQFSCNLDDINWISDQLGIPWQLEKDQLWSSSIVFTGFVWEVDKKTVTLSSEKRSKYRQAIMEFQGSRTHALKSVQKLYGKLLHASFIIPEGRAYLTSLERCLALFHDAPFKPLTPPRATKGDLDWWLTTLLGDGLSRALYDPTVIQDLHAFSDASSGVGIGVQLGNRWRAWKLRDGWKTEKRDIGWAEAIGFEFLIRTIIQIIGGGRAIRVYGDNKGVVEGWWNGRSRNEQTNAVFRRIHSISRVSELRVLTSYVASANNPADNPSRGIFPPLQLLLPPITIPDEIRDFVEDFDFRFVPVGVSSSSQPKPQREAGREQRAFASFEQSNREGEILISLSEESDD
ncbi:hypothetical protein PHLCEN_2v11915 [Hermanssonia centrifuga]|uniref:Uncharacterized protein n=1 Tax=Hermanssonia centrifuga TaxID=98765 RepID=A0A2R6NIY8_9APHY|nr:hypothetical protein PHLCEN_2v11915 [Hermanssonia centrifuga]